MRPWRQSQADSGETDYHVGEFSFFDWTDADFITVLVPSDYSGDGIDVTVDLNSKRIPVSDES
jgi:hypothetical protein